MTLLDCVYCGLPGSDLAHRGGATSAAAVAAANARLAAAGKRAHLYIARAAMLGLPKPDVRTPAGVRHFNLAWAIKLAPARAA